MSMTIYKKQIGNKPWFARMTPATQGRHLKASLSTQRKLGILAQLSFLLQ